MRRARQARQGSGGLHHQLVHRKPEARCGQGGREAGVMRDCHHQAVKSIRSTCHPVPARLESMAASCPNQCSIWRLLVLPSRIYTTAGPAFCRTRRTAKPSSLVMMLAPFATALAQMAASDTRSRPQSKTCSAWCPRSLSSRASAKGSCAPTRKRITPPAGRDGHFATRRTAIRRRYRPLRGKDSPREFPLASRHSPATQLRLLPLPATHELGVDGNPVHFIHDELLISLQNRASCRHASKRAQRSRSPIHQRGTP